MQQTVDEAVATSNFTVVYGVPKIPPIHPKLNSQVAHLPKKVTQIPRSQATRPLELSWWVILKVKKDQSA